MLRQSGSSQIWDKHQLIPADVDKYNAETKILTLPELRRRKSWIHAWKWTMQRQKNTKCTSRYAGQWISDVDNQCCVPTSEKVRLQRSKLWRLSPVNLFIWRRSHNNIKMKFSKYLFRLWLVNYIFHYIIQWADQVPFLCNYLYLDNQFYNHIIRR